MLKNKTNPLGLSYGMMYRQPCLIWVFPYTLPVRKRGRGREDLREGFPACILHICDRFWSLYISTFETKRILFSSNEFWLFETRISHKIPSKNSAVLCTATVRNKPGLSMPWFSLKHKSDFHKKSRMVSLNPVAWQCVQDFSPNIPPAV